MSFKKYQEELGYHAYVCRNPRFSKKGQELVCEKCGHLIQTPEIDSTQLNKPSRVLSDLIKRTITNENS